MRGPSRYERFIASVFCFGLFIASALVILPRAARGQTTTAGTIIGVVTDNTNAVVPGATVTLTMKSTNAVRTTATDNAGHYVFADIEPGAYDIRVEKQGFASTVIANQVVQVGLQLTENVKLQIGAVSTTVTVTENRGAELQTLTPTVGTTLNAATINNLTNFSRDASTLTTLEPGQNINGNTGGAASDQNTFDLDGGMATDDMSGDNNTYIAAFGYLSNTAGVGNYHSSGYAQSPSAVVPMPITSIQEFKVSTANQTADFNGGAGSETEVVTKRGTNTWHGGGYEYYLDDNFAGANTWDNNSTGTAQPGYHFNRFGADAGGKIPHSNFLGGNWYIFDNYEGFRYPLSSEFEQDFPLPSLRAGIIHLPNAAGVVQTFNLNPFPVMDPGCGAATTDCKVTTTGQTIAPTMCPSGPCDPRSLGTTMNGAAGGTPNPVIAMWNQYLPLPNDCSHGDSLNFCGYKGSISTPQTSNFNVARIDHDFNSKWHFNGTYHYYNLHNTVDDQWDVGGFFPGDTLGQYAAIRQEPQVPWLFTAGLTTNITSNVTNDVHYSFTRNYWAYGDPGGPPNVAGYPAALEVGGENYDVFGPYDTANQDTRTRFWDGKDNMVRDDVTWIKGNHLFQIGGLWERNNDTHNRNDNGETINTYEQYLIGAGGTGCGPLSAYNVSFAGYEPAAIAGTGEASCYDNLASMALGMVNETQQLYTRGTGTTLTGLPLNPLQSCAVSGIAATADCMQTPPAVDDSIIPTYNLYFSDAWHLKPTFSLNYGLGYTVEMPPYSASGYETVMVGQNNQILSAPTYFNQVQQAALQGQAYAPEIGFDTVRNVQYSSKYPYDPYYGGLSPRVGFAWNFRPDTVLRGGFAQIFGRINGVDPLLVPMLTPGLMQPDTCAGPTNAANGSTCGTAGTPTTPVTAFRVGVDGTNAPLPPPPATLPQPWYPGVNGIASGAGETIDPDFKPNRSDEFTLSVQHQFGPKILVEVGYIGRMISNEIEYYSLTAVPYMMTQGGQTFANAWANEMVGTNYGTDAPPATLSSGAANPAFTEYVNGLTPQPFFEAALKGSPYCTGYASCTAAFVANSINNGSMLSSSAFNAWTSVSSLGSNGFTGFGRTMTSDPIPSSPVNGVNGQMPSISTTASNGYGNYNAGYVQLTTTDWHGLTMKTNFTWSNALGTGTVVQATSEYSSVDDFNLANDYGPQPYNDKYTFNFFINYAEPFFRNQNSVLGRLLGGWNFAPLFIAGSGFPVQLQTGSENCGSYGECNTAYIFAYENMVATKNLNYSAREHQAGGPTSSDTCGYAGAGYNVFSNPDATCPIDGGTFSDPVRDPILGYDGDIGGGGPLTGLPFWNLDLGITKKVNLTERFSSSLYFDWSNVLNHMQPADPCFEDYNPSTWGVLGCGGNLQANQPRQLQLGVSLDF